MPEVASSALTAREARLRARSGELDGTTGGLAMGFMQTNLVIVPKPLAWDFLLFCQRNPRPCPIIEVLDCGSWEPRESAPGADLRTDLPRYRVFEHGKLVDEPTDILRWWRDDLVAFLLGCSFSFEQALQRAGLPLRHLEENKTVSMYRTSIRCKPAGPFEGPLVVSMRPLTPMQAVKASEITSHYPLAHGAPVHVGDAAAIGIKALDQPDYGEAVSIHDGELPVFWACAVTPQAAISHARPPLAITHAPGRMFITDLPVDAGMDGTP
jgi:uncharacterized protein YcsI (UPF0317 family)